MDGLMGRRKERIEGVEARNFEGDFFFFFFWFGLWDRVRGLKIVKRRIVIYGNRHHVEMQLKENVVFQLCY